MKIKWNFSIISLTGRNRQTSILLNFFDWDDKIKRKYVFYQISLRKLKIYIIFIYIIYEYMYVQVLQRIVNTQLEPRSPSQADLGLIELMWCLFCSPLMKLKIWKSLDVSILFSITKSSSSLWTFILCVCIVFFWKRYMYNLVVSIWIFE